MQISGTRFVALACALGIALGAATRAGAQDPGALLTDVTR